MSPEERNEQSMIKTALIVVLSGAVIGVYYVWYEWSWNNLLSGIVAGIGSTAVFVLTTEVFKFRKYGLYLYIHTVIAGLAGGLVWWLIATTRRTSLFLC